MCRGLFLFFFFSSRCVFVIETKAKKTELLKTRARTTKEGKGKATLKKKRMRSISRGSDRKRAEDAIRQCELSRLASHCVDHLSARRCWRVRRTRFVRARGATDLRTTTTSRSRTARPSASTRTVRISFCARHNTRAGRQRAQGRLRKQ